MTTAMVIINKSDSNQCLTVIFRLENLRDRVGFTKFGVGQQAPAEAKEAVMSQDFAGMWRLV
jgi:hypothetical protein